MENKPNYDQLKEGYSICFNEWALDKNIKNELGLLLIISSLCADKGFCWATNEYLGSLFNEPNQTISRKIKKLEDNNYIAVEYKKEGYRVANRVIRLTKLLNADYQNCEPPINKNVKENNISNKNIKENNKEIIKEIIDYLNSKGGTSFKENNKKTVSLINARLNQGYTVDDFKDVIWRKYLDWVDEPYKFANGQMSDTYFRPSTLFNETNFENYLQEYHKLADNE